MHLPSLIAVCSLVPWTMAASISTVFNATGVAHDAAVAAKAAASCPWPGHCEGDRCRVKDDCWGEAECPFGAESWRQIEGIGRCRPKTCPWIGHCAGGACNSMNDCWGKAMCASGWCVPYVNNESCDSSKYLCEWDWCHHPNKPCAPGLQCVWLTPGAPAPVDVRLCLDKKKYPQ
ncbi:hypothetical protein BDZ88DRAFT_456395 [Geranomyces variabilis]|nr:hypothetical protein BDZ88DRAFT_456395 [Geranomyces variabilis]KAJ3135804.1 hypothetical protein HDU90_003543 [Geranomyces variabilis]